jgi:hypothetical protein
LNEPPPFPLPYELTYKKQVVKGAGSASKIVEYTKILIKQKKNLHNHTRYRHCTPLKKCCRLLFEQKIEQDLHVPAAPACAWQYVIGSPVVVTLPDAPPPNPKYPKT